MVEPSGAGIARNDRASLARFAWLSIAAALATIVLKAVAYLLTGSVGLLSDALESFVNLAGALMALAMLSLAARPADESHAYGHGKAEYFSSGVEGGLILIAALSIGVAAVDRLLHPRPLEQLGRGLAVSVVASLVNLGVGLVLMRAARQYESITLKANAHHLMTDVWTSVGVIGGVAVTGFTGWSSLDPIVAILVALNIVWTGYRLIGRSVAVLMDAKLSQSDHQSIEFVMTKYIRKGVNFHALRTRQAAARKFVSVHILFPGNWTVHDAHHIAEDFENEVRTALGGIITVFTHPSDSRARSPGRQTGCP